MRKPENIIRRSYNSCLMPAVAVIAIIALVKHSFNYYKINVMVFRIYSNFYVAILIKSSETPV
jgi:hypothetical protein